jgi:2Fe-2S iron-sulfur cluster binding domain
MGEVAVQLTVNGRATEATVEPRLTLADFLRERCHLTGTHLGCEHGVCGACTVPFVESPARHQQLAHGVDPRQQPGRPGWGAASRASVALAVIADLASSGHNLMRAHSS